MDFGMDSMFEALDEGTRSKLVEVLRLRGDYLELSVTVNRLKIDAAEHPTRDRIERLQDYSEAVVAPMRRRYSEEAVELLKDAVDVEQMKTMMPMVLMALMQSINLPLILTVLGIDPDAVVGMTTEMKDYFESDMP